MTNYTNLNIVGSDHTFKYILEVSDKMSISDDELGYFSCPDGVSLTNNYNIIQYKNYWQSYSGEILNEYIPETRHTQQVTLFFPRYSMETYEKRVRYILTISTWINGKNVSLGSTILDRGDALACTSGPRTFLNDQYFEELSFSITSPYYLMYGEEWKDFRQNILGVKEGYNEGGSNLNVMLCPVEEVDNHFIKYSGYNESQSAILLSHNVDDYLSCHISSNVDKAIVNAKINVAIKFNGNYDQTNEGLQQYLLETYNIKNEDIITRFILLVQDQENVYKYIQHDHQGLVMSDNYTKAEFEYEDWSEYMEGLNIYVIYQILNKDDEEDEWLGAKSNALFFDQELYKYFVGNNVINQVKLNQVDMNNYKIDVVNKIVEQVVQVERPDDYKANIIKPVFFKVNDTANIMIHPAVTENICINLDAYKNKVDVFSIKIKDYTFKEIGRISNGVVFKIVGSMIEFSDEDSNTGTYYILNDEGELVTTGNFTAVLV